MYAMMSRLRRAVEYVGAATLTATEAATGKADKEDALATELSEVWQMCTGHDDDNADELIEL